MKLLTNYPVRVGATGFVVMTLLSIPLFWLGFLCRVSLSVRAPDSVRDKHIEPSGYISPDIDTDPNLVQRSKVVAMMRPEMITFSLGILEYFQSRRPGGTRSSVFSAESKDDWAYFEEPSGRIICRYNETEAMPDGSRLYRQVQYYTGPEGISEIPDESVGRFLEPIIDRTWIGRTLRREKPYDLILYDRGLRCFFKIDFDKATITKGPQISDEGNRDPVQIGLLAKNQALLDLIWMPPKIDVSKLEKMDFSKLDLPDSPYILPGTDYAVPGRGVTLTPLTRSHQYHHSNPHLLVLDKSGRIELLDKETLEFTGTAGHLPRLSTLFGAEAATTPYNSLSYSVSPLYIEQRLRQRDPEDNSEPPLDPNAMRYAGTFAASLSRDGTSMSVTAFDDEGKPNRRTYSRQNRYATSDMFYFGTAGAPLATLGKYITESLHPPILSVGSCLTASAFEAGAGHRALFLLPDSFVAMNARDNRDGLGVKIVTALLLISPSLILAAWLECRVTRDVATVGLSNNLRRFWACLTLAFGLAGYITYRLTRPKVTLVTCPNCGKGRRPDTETCHHCGQGWDIPELDPPGWRVISGPGG